MKTLLTQLITLLCPILEWSKLNAPGGKLKKILKVVVFLDHSLIIIRWTWKVFFPKFKIWSLPTIRHKRVKKRGINTIWVF